MPIDFFWMFIINSIHNISSGGCGDAGFVGHSLDLCDGILLLLFVLYPSISTINLVFIIDCFLFLVQTIPWTLTGQVLENSSSNRMGLLMATMNLSVSTKGGTVLICLLIFELLDMLPTDCSFIYWFWTLYCLGKVCSRKDIRYKKGYKYFLFQLRICWGAGHRWNMCFYRCAIPRCPIIICRA